MASMDLQNKPPDYSTFKYDSDLVEAHPFHKLNPEDDTNTNEKLRRFDGSKARIIIFPGILAYGKESAEDYHEWKVWAKAQVWMEEPDPSRR
jgi:hypothetical protein